MSLQDPKSFLWGQSTRVLVGATPDITSQQVLQVSLPTPAVCAIYLNVVYELGGSGNVFVFTANFQIGVGRTNLKRTLVWSNQPAPGAPIEVVIPAQPLAALQLDCSVEGLGAPSFELTIGAELAPITHIPTKAHEGGLHFGMALPGEADGIDDDAFDEMEEYEPDLVENLREAQRQQARPFEERLRDLLEEAEQSPSHRAVARMHAEANARAVRRRSRRFYP